MPWLTYQQIGDRFGMNAEAARGRVRRLGWRTQPGNDGRTLALLPDDIELHPGGVRTPDPDDIQVDVRADAERLAAAEARAERADERADETGRRADAALALVDRALAQLADAGERAGRLERDLAAALSAAEQAEAARDQAEQATTAERARADALRDRLNAQRVVAETTEAHTAALRDRLDAMQAQLTEAHAALQAAVETERRAGQAEQEIAGERTRADALRDRLDASQAQLGAAETAAELARRHAQEAQDAAEALRQADDARRALGRWARIRRAWRGE